MKPPVTRDEMEKSETRLFELKRRYLEEHGWEYTCKTPGSTWLWRKQHMEEIFLCSMPVALCTEEALSAQ